MKALYQRGLLARVGPIAVAAIALVTACSSTEPTAPKAGKEPPLALVSAPSRPTAAHGDAKLSELIENAPKSVIAGERLNVELLKRFYARHGFAPVWTTRQGQANSLIDAVSRAGEHGLSPDLFHASLLQSPSVSALDRELLLSDAFLSYADALARGFMPLERRRDDHALTPDSVDVAVVLDTAIGSPDPAAVIDALAPTTPTYRLLRQALKDARASGATARLREIAVNLERERWLPRRLPADRVWVNAADERLVLYRDDRPVFSTRVIVGQDDVRNQSPEFEVPITAVWFNPPWNIPNDIATNEIMPKARLDPTYLAKRNIVMLPDGSLQQKAGANSGLGQLIFEMTNRFDVYLHDTPGKHLFSLTGRRISHGCIRVENPQQLAALLMRQPIDDINETIKTGDTIRRTLPRPVPVFVVYETAFADADGKLQYRADSYRRDAAIWKYLDPKARAVTVAER
ncbi:MAG: L,D-transpeptidase family protein [Rhodospirillales bacterium]|nr:L,D-transpeptidase family protein [Rhodospirillales bacterium]